MAATCCSVIECSSPDCVQLTDREARVCKSVCASEVPIGFSAIRRSVGLHQEIVSRILRRLVVHGAIENVEGKYRRRTGQ